MLLRPRLLSVSLVGVMTWLAAAADAGWQRPTAQSTMGTAQPAPLPLIARESLETDVAAIPAIPPPPLQSEPSEVQYRQLRAINAQCLAVLNSSAGSLIARERARLAETHRCCQRTCVQFLLPRQCDQSATNLKIAILYYSELEARNRDAGRALELYYRLAELEVKSDLLAAAAADLADAIKRSRDLMQQGFKLPIEITTLQRQEIDARADGTRLSTGIVELNGKLKELIGQEDLPSDHRLLPTGGFEVAFAPVEVDETIRLGLTHRAELNLLRTALRDLDSKTLPVVRDFLKGLNALLGESDSGSTPIAKACVIIKELLTTHSAERTLRHTQLQQLLAERERAVADEVRQALAEWHTRGQLLVLGRERLVASMARQQEAHDKAKSGTGSFLEVLNANLDAYKARGLLTEDVMGWHAAKARLKQAQGVLVLECCQVKAE